MKLSDIIASTQVTAAPLKGKKGVKRSLSSKFSKGGKGKKGVKRSLSSKGLHYNGPKPDGTAPEHYSHHEEGETTPFLGHRKGKGFNVHVEEKTKTGPSLHSVEEKRHSALSSAMRHAGWSPEVSHHATTGREGMKTVHHFHEGEHHVEVHAHHDPATQRAVFKAKHTSYSRSGEPTVKHGVASSNLGHAIESATE